MSNKLDQLLLAFLHGDLPAWKRLFVRFKLFGDRGARARLAELQYTSALIAGTFAAAEPAALQANLAVRLRRAAVTDAAVLALISSVVVASAAVTWGRYISSTLVEERRSDSYYPVRCTTGSEDPGPHYFPPPVNPPHN